MTLKKTYSIAIDRELSEQIEKHKKTTGKTYTEIFEEGIKKVLRLEND